MKKLIFAVCTVAAGSALLAADVESDKVYGIVNVASTNANTIISAPWIGTDGAAFSVSNIVSTASLANGDKLYLYDDTTGKWSGYTLESGSWTPDQTVTADTVAAVPVAKTSLPRGTAMVLVRTDKSKPIIMGGKYDKTPSPKTVTKGTTALIGNPTAEPRSISNDTGNDGDSILVFGDGSTTSYDKITKNGVSAWYGWAIDENTNRKKQVKLENGVSVPPGTGIMYVCSSADDAVAVTVWDD